MLLKIIIIVKVIEIKAQNNNNNNNNNNHGLITAFHKNDYTSAILKYKIYYSISDWICRDMAIEISFI